MRSTTPPTPDGDSTQSAEARQIPARVPEKIGHYHIKRVIASGGMGTVYEAVQEHPRRVVAVKVMKHGIASRSAMRRFEYEGQILARLRHPGIAQIYEAGVHGFDQNRADPSRDREGAGIDSVPYFAMEYIPNARPITTYAREKKLGTRERMKLFAQVCEAVHHGHQKGIIHRDLKPSNILVDSNGQAKIIDFGVARSTDSDMAVTTLQTDVGQLIGTLQYMSPEQCEADPHDIDTRSDVYALGVVFYELLCGKPPYDLTGVPMHHATRIIREQEPTKLSTLDKTLRGDVETIALKALEKERSRRYQSAAEFAQDIERYLTSRPIHARPPSAIYQLRVFARRNKGYFATGAAVLVLLLGATIFSTVQYMRAESARKAAVAAERLATTEASKSEQVASFMTNMLKGVGPSVALGRDTTMLREILDETGRRVAKELADQPDVQATIRNTLGVTYRALGEYPAAETHLRAALGLRRQHFGDEHETVAEGLHELGELLLLKSEYDESEPLLRESLAMRRKLLGTEHTKVAESMNDLALVLQYKGDYDKAEPLYRESLAMSRRLLGDDHPDTLSIINNMGFLLTAQGKLDEAFGYWREALEGQRRVLGDDHPDTLRSINNMGFLLNKLGRHDEAAEVLLAGEAAARRVWTGANAWKVGTYLAKLGEARTGLGAFPEAEKTLLEAHGLLAAGLGDDHEATTKTIERIISLYDAWDAADPGNGHAEKAADWRGKLEEATKRRSDGATKGEEATEPRSNEATKADGQTPVGPSER